jgi:peptidoglycan hydrolase CwlO-like protein
MKMKKPLLILSIFCLIFLLGSTYFVYAQTDKEKEKAALEEELKRLELQIAEANRGITATEAEKQSLQYQIRKLQNEINSLSAQINRNRVVIQSLGLKIADTQGSIIKTTEKIAKSQEELAETLRILNMEGKTSTLEILLSENNLSAVFSSLNSLERLSGETKVILDEVKKLRRSLQGYKEELEGDRSETEKVAKIQEAQKAEEERARAERQRLYGLTEAEYQKQVAEKKELEKQAEDIRRRIFELAGLPEDVQAPTFKEAYDIAKWVESLTGIRPAFLLSILQQESSFGKNVGQCHIADTTSGASIHIRTGQRYSNGIHPTRDIPPFLVITSELGRDPLKTPVSCPLSYGYGGAMGPAQFIPSTWMMYKDRLKGLLGRAANPWSIRDSFLASGVLLTDSGARARTREGEWRAAMIYFSGGTTNSSFFWYADQVVARADQFEKDIQIMLQN